MRSRSVFASTAASILMLTSAACGGQGKKDSTPNSVGAPSGPASANGPAGAPPGAKVLGTPRSGEPFTLTITYTDNSEPTKIEITVKSVTCGKPLDQAALDYTAEATGTTAPTPKPEDGKQYCVATLDARNVGNAEISWDADNTTTLNVGSVRYSQSQDDARFASDYAQYWAKEGKKGPSFGLNPGSKGPVPAVFQIPAAAKPTSLWVTSGTAVETIDGVEDGFLVQL